MPITWTPRDVGSWNPFIRREAPHPLLCGTDGVIDILPDHPHEGEVLGAGQINLNATFTFGSLVNRPEYPTVGGTRPEPEIVARAHVRGDHSPADFKGVANAGAFGVIGAYDGHPSRRRPCRRRLDLAPLVRRQLGWPARQLARFGADGWHQPEDARLLRDTGRHERVGPDRQLLPERRALAVSPAKAALHVPARDPGRGRPLPPDRATAPRPSPPTCWAASPTTRSGDAPASAR